MADQQGKPAEAWESATNDLVENARRSAAVFASYVLRDEKTGAPITPQPMHAEWHALADRHTRLVLWSFVESAKTTQLSVIRPIWLLGRNPNLRLAVLSNTSGQAVKIVRGIARYIETSPEVAQVFPNLRKSARDGDPWTSSMLTFQRPIISRDPSIQACGVHGNVLGSRLDGVILDDILDFENTRTHAQRRDLQDWIEVSIMGRLTKGAFVLAVGTAFHPSDLLSYFARQGSGWFARKYPLLLPDGTCRWPEAYPPSRIVEKRTDMGSAEFARQMLCMPRSDEEGRFRREWIEQCLVRGRGVPLLPYLDAVPDGYATFTGVDLGVRTGEHSDKTAIFTLLLHPEGDRQLIGIEAGRWTGPEIVRRLYDTHKRYGSIIYVENVAAQDLLIQFVREMGSLPIRPFTTGTNKAHPEFGIEGLAVEMQSGKWIIPNGPHGELDPAVDEWINELLYFDPREHVGDSAMASWFAREGCRRFEWRERGGAGVTIVSGDGTAS